MDTPLLKRAYNLGLKAVPNFTALSEEQIRYYETHLDELREAICRGFIIPEVPESAQPEKFTLLVDLGIITVPDDYDHATHLASFSRKNKKKFYYYNDAITDANFPNPSRVSKPGDKLWVRVFQQVTEGTTTSVERLAFLDTQKAIHTGAQGASLVWEQKRNQLPKGKWYASFDEEERLWQAAVGDLRVPGVGARLDGVFAFVLGYLGDVWDESDAFFCFCDLPA